MSWWVGGSLCTCSLLFFWSRCCCYCCPQHQYWSGERYRLLFLPCPFSLLLLLFPLRLFYWCCCCWEGICIFYFWVEAQQQLARDLEVERAAMGQRCRPQSCGEVQQGNPQPRWWLDFLRTLALLLYSRRTWGYCSWRNEQKVVFGCASSRSAWKLRRGPLMNDEWVTIIISNRNKAVFTVKTVWVTNGRRYAVIAMPGSSLCMLQLGLGMNGPCRRTNQGGLSAFVSRTMQFLVSFQVHIIRDWSGQL